LVRLEQARPQEWQWSQISSYIGGTVGFRKWGSVS
jgi:hypothetical protein